MILLIFFPSIIVCLFSSSLRVVLLTLIDLEQIWNRFEQSQPVLTTPECLDFWSKHFHYVYNLSFSWFNTILENCLRKTCRVSLKQHLSILGIITTDLLSLQHFLSICYGSYQFDAMSTYHLCLSPFEILCRIKILSLTLSKSFFTKGFP